MGVLYPSINNFQANREHLMFPKPQSEIIPNTHAFEITPLVKPTGFREYRAGGLGIQILKNHRN